MSTLLKPLLVREKLLERGIKVFTILDFKRLFPQNPARIKYFLETQTKQGLFIQLKKGLYALKTDLPGDEEIANILYMPSYISFEYALARYGIIPESPYHITSATTNPTRVFEAGSQAYLYNTIKRQAYAGYYLETRGDRRVLIAEPEKALADFLYYVSIGKRTINDRIDISKLNVDKLKEYAVLFDREKILKLIRQLK